MSEKQLQNFDIKCCYNLCEKIIKNRDFQCLIDLNEQCGLLYHGKYHSEDYSCIDETLILRNFSIEEETLLILLYYIYYILLDKKERNIFVFIQKLITLKNIFLFNALKEYYENTNEEFDIYPSDEEKYCFNCGLFILEQYTKMKIFKDDDIFNIDDINYKIHEFKQESYDNINNDLYLLYMLAIGDLPYQEYLSSMSYDILIQNFIDVTEIVLNKFNKNMLDVAKDENISDFEMQADELRF